MDACEEMLKETDTIFWKYDVGKRYHTAWSSVIVGYSFIQRFVALCLYVWQYIFTWHIQTTLIDGFIHIKYIGNVQCLTPTYMKELVTIPIWNAHQKYQV